MTDRRVVWQYWDIDAGIVAPGSYDADHLISPSVPLSANAQLIIGITTAGLGTFGAMALQTTIYGGTGTAMTFGAMLAGDDTSGRSKALITCSRDNGGWDPAGLITGTGGRLHLHIENGLFSRPVSVIVQMAVLDGPWHGFLPYNKLLGPPGGTTGSLRPASATFTGSTGSTGAAVYENFVPWVAMLGTSGGGIAIFDPDASTPPVPDWQPICLTDSGVNPAAGAHDGLPAISQALALWPAPYALAPQSASVTWDLSNDADWWVAAVSAQVGPNGGRPFPQVIG